jgi:hypothetical protein
VARRPPRPNLIPALGRSSGSPRPFPWRPQLRHRRRPHPTPSGGSTGPHPIPSGGSPGPHPTPSGGSPGPHATPSPGSPCPQLKPKPGSLRPHRRRRRSTRPVLRTSRPPTHPRSCNRPRRPSPSSSPPGRRISSPPAAPPKSTRPTTRPRRPGRPERGRGPRRLRSFLLHTLRSRCAGLPTKARPAQRIQPPRYAVCVSTHRGRTTASPGHVAP